MASDWQYWDLHLALKPCMSQPFCHGLELWPLRKFSLIFSLKAIPALSRALSGLVGQRSSESLLLARACLFWKMS